MPQNPNTVVFDVGNVLFRWKPEEFYLKILKDEDRLRWYMDHVHNVEWNIDLDLGLEEWDAAFEKRIRAFPDWQEPLRAYQVNWFDTMTDRIEDNIALLRRLTTADVPTYAITNFNDYTFATVRERHYDFLRLFDGVIVSGEEQLVKPDPAIYALLCSRYGLEPADCVFIDDNPANIAAARRYGMHGIHFVEPLDVAAELGKLGISAALAK